jgi:hypothetical protein
MKRAQPFIVTADHNAALSLLDGQELQRRTQPMERQLMLFDASNPALTGEL